MPRQRSQKAQSKAIKTSPEASKDNIDQSFPIVAIGSSAGGLEPCSQILSKLPTDTGMAFVVVQHLAPAHKSMLSEIFARATQMPVLQVEDNTIVEPNHVYVIPPNFKMTIAQGVLKLTPREQVRGIFMSVDAFFISLAAERGNKAIAVILSGGDSDGARGIEEIKAAGGITFAQCQDTAKVDSMPNTAVATGQVDFILCPEDIAKELIKISRHPYITRSNPIQIIEEQPEENAFSNIFALLKAATGVDFTNYKQTTLKRRIARRMALYKIEKLSTYVQYLQNNSEEVTALYHDVLINVTSFFRDSEAFEALRSKVFPVIVKDKTPTTPVRVWVAGCSTGEEAYSIAICLQEFLAEQAIKVPVQIYATDLSDTVIEKARTGIYKHNQLVDVSPQRLQRFFMQVESGYQISKTIREQCVFARQNLIGDPPFSRLDLITCRNVLIYLGANLQKKLLPVFHYGLKPTGFLMLGTSETVGDFLDLFNLVDKKSKIYSRKLVSAPLNVDLFASNYSPQIISPQVSLSDEAQDDFDLQKEADRIVLSQFAPVGVIINSDLDIVQFRGKTSTYLEPAPGRASLNLLKMAKPELRLELRTALQQAKKQETAISKTDIFIKEGDRVKQVQIDVILIKTATGIEGNYLVLFKEISSTSQKSSALSEGQTSDQEVARLRQELAATKEHLQSIIEEQQATNQDLRAANEEILSSNEELQSTNEELETAKEEIQAANEELNTINDELYRRNIESTHVSNDLQNLLSSINIPILMLEGDLRIRRFTPLAQSILKLIPTDVGRPFGDINHNLSVADLEAQIIEVISTLTVKVQEVQDQTGHWYDLRIRPYRTIDNKIDGAVLILVDIDALKRSAEQLLASRNYAETIVETMQEALVVMDTNLQVIRANRSFYEMFQTTPAATEQRLIYELGNGQWNIEGLRSQFEEILPAQSEMQVQDFEVEYNFEQIGRKIMLLNAKKLLQANSEEMILLTIKDITQARQLQAELTQLLAQEQSARTAAEAANLAKDEFLSMLSHELRNPLNSLLGWAQLLNRPNIEPARITQGLESIKRSALTQSKLIEDLLDISRITSGKLRLNVYPISLAQIITAALQVIQVSADAKQIQIESNLDLTPHQILGDLERIQQILSNLLSNAIKFTPSDGRVSVTLTYTDSLAQIQVSDTGIGISAEFLPHIFERFRQADGSPTRSNTGLGLGLTIVRHLIELHGGTIEAESSGTGQGSSFIVKLPLKSNLEAVTPEKVETTETEDLQPVIEKPSLNGIRLLIVDDEADNRQIFKMLLEQEGCIVTEAASAREALAKLSASPEEFDVLLSDISMPEEDGYTLIRQVRALNAEAGGQIPAAALTAYAGSQDQEKAIAAGFQMHLAKPVELLQVALVVATLAGRISSN
ncbi:MAG: chemotaxis protein CheB [Coleofasciculaceae cyanobacterium]